MITNAAIPGSRSTRLIRFGEFHFAPFAAAATDDGDGDDDEDDINMPLM